MGNLFGSLFGGGEGKASTVFIDFDTPGDVEDPEGQALNDECEALHVESTEVIALIEKYAGCNEAIRDAMSNPKDDEIQRRSFMALVPNIQLVKRMHDHGQEIEKVVPKLLERLIASEALDGQQCLAVRLAQILNFVVKFDQIKMNTPPVQNDFAYYRRVMHKFRTEAGETGVDEMAANYISMFLAQHIPMMLVLQKACKDVVKGPELIGTFANACCGMVLQKAKNGLAERPETVMYTLSAMTGACILFDHIRPVFTKGSGVQIKGCVKILVAHKPEAEALMNALRYNSAHYKDASDDIKKLFA